jgi:type I restriction enzyme S subunit
VSDLITDNLPLIATAPDGIKRLRGLILELAVRGKLVPQDPTDEPASELLKRIEAEKARLVKEGQIRKPKAVEAVGEDDRPFAVPAGWEWARFGNVGMIGSSSRVHQKDWTTSGIPFYRAREIVKLSRDGYVDNDLFISPELYESLSSSGNCPEPNDLMITGVGTIGIPYVVQQNDRFYFKDASVLMFKNLFHLPTDYLRLFCLSPYWIKVIHDSSMGTTVHTLTIVRANEVAVPLPPLPEQHRIVARVDELMALCDRLEAEQADAAEAHARLIDALLATLTASRDAAECAAQWQRLSEHFDTLFTTEASITALNQTVLQLAVMGRLVPQDPSDEPSTRSSQGVCSDSLPLELPANWTATTLGEHCEIAGGMTPTKSRDDYWGDGLPWVSPKDMKVEFITDAQDHITERALSETTIRPIPLGSLLVVVRGMILAHSFPVAITRTAVTINQDMKALTPHVSAFAPYLMLVCKGFKYEILKLVERSSHGTCKLETPKLLSFPFGLPPLPEQHRIVAKVDELMALCERLQADLATARDHRARLADTLVQAALEAA